MATSKQTQAAKRNVKKARKWAAANWPGNRAKASG
jgi:hypothetical protein